MSLAAGDTEMVIVRTRAWLCALPVSDVLETFRALPVEPVDGMASFVRGLSVVRGEPLPVVDLAALFGASDGARGARFVVLRVGGRRAVLEVDEVVAVRPIARAELVAAPPLLGAAVRAHVDSLGALDGELLAVLRAGQLISEAAPAAGGPAC